MHEDICDHFGVIRFPEVRLFKANSVEQITYGIQALLNGGVALIKQDTQTNSKKALRSNHKEVQRDETVSMTGEKEFITNEPNEPTSFYVYPFVTLTGSLCFLGMWFVKRR